MGRVILIKKFLVSPLPILSDFHDTEKLQPLGKRFVSYGLDINILDGVPVKIEEIAAKRKFAGKKTIDINKLEITYLPSGLSTRGRRNKFYEQPDFMALLSIGSAPRDIHIYEKNGTSLAKLNPGDLLLISEYDFSIPADLAEKKETTILIYKGIFAA